MWRKSNCKYIFIRMKSLPENCRISFEEIRAKEEKSCCTVPDERKSLSVQGTGE